MNFPAHCGDVVMLDVLHYFSDQDQQRLLGKIAASIAPRGIALIRLALNESTWRFVATELEEWFVGVGRWIPELRLEFSDPRRSVFAVQPGAVRRRCPAHVGRDALQQLSFHLQAEIAEADRSAGGQKNLSGSVLAEYSGGKGESLP